MTVTPRNKLLHITQLAALHHKKGHILGCPTKLINTHHRCERVRHKEWVKDRESENERCESGAGNKSGTRRWARARGTNEHTPTQPHIVHTNSRTRAHTRTQPAICIGKGINKLQYYVLINQMKCLHIRMGA